MKTWIKKEHKKSVYMFGKTKRFFQLNSIKLIATYSLIKTFLL